MPALVGGFGKIFMFAVIDCEVYNYDDTICGKLLKL